MPDLRCSHCGETIPAGAHAVHVGADEVGRPVVYASGCLEATELRVVARSCRGCGRELLAASWNATPPYCSIGCWTEGLVRLKRERSAERVEDPSADELRLPPERARECAECGASLESARRTTRFCAAACRQAAYRRRKAAA